MASVVETVPMTVRADDVPGAVQGCWTYDSYAAIAAERGTPARSRLRTAVRRRSPLHASRVSSHLRIAGIVPWAPLENGDAARPDLANDIAVGAFHLDDIGAHVREDLGGIGSHQDRGQIENRKTAERTHGNFLESVCPWGICPRQDFVRTCVFKVHISVVDT